MRVALKPGLPVVVGVAAFVPQLRMALGRRVSHREIEMRWLPSIARWNEWNLDLVFGIPGQTWETRPPILTRAVSACPAHFSLFDLTYTGRSAPGGRDPRAGARRPRAFGRNTMPMPPPTRGCRIRRYDVSDFAIPVMNAGTIRPTGAAEDYLGVGASAVSRLGMERRTNPRIGSDYLAGRRPSRVAVRRRRACGRRPCWDCEPATESMKPQCSQWSIILLATGFLLRAVWRGAMVNFG